MVCVLLCLASQSFADPAPAQVRKVEFGAQLTFPTYTLRVMVRGPETIRVTAAPDPKSFSAESLTVVPRTGPKLKWDFDQNSHTVTVQAERVQAQIDRLTGQVTFLDGAGKIILQETSDGRTLTPAEVVGEKVLQVRQQWTPPEDEALYGLGQNQGGVLDLKGRDLDLWQRNSEVFIPFLVSSRGYGILWDNTSRTRFGDLRMPEPIPAKLIHDTEGKPGGFTGTYFADPRFARPVATRSDAMIDFNTIGAVEGSNATLHSSLPAHDVSVRWLGTFEAPTAGLYSFQTYSDGGVHLWIDDDEVVNHWRQNWLPGDELGQINLQPGVHRLRLEWTKDQGADRIKLLWKTPSTDHTTSLWSEASQVLDYYFVYGPSIDKVIAGYRKLTGAAPLMPQWAFGLWQSRQRYETSQQSIDVVKGFRTRKIPFDNIVQDWFYWPKDKWGSHEFDAARFPDPAGWVKQLHDELHSHIMISVWGKFYPGTSNFEAMNRAGYLFEPNLKENAKDWLGYPFTFYDDFIPDARRLFWNQVDQGLFRHGFDAWWLDATEPDLLPTPNLEGQRTHLQSKTGGKRIQLLNAYSLAQSQAFYEGQRAKAPNKRVFILTRSSFAGAQRYAASTWSGDITSTWTAMRKQITAGLGFSISGVPYWTMDAGGFSVPARFSRKDASPSDVAEWRELNTRWFEFATFVPLLRTHGESPFREMWEFGGEESPSYHAMLKFDRLRYRLFPYIYSQAAAVTRDASTLLRPLVMDFPKDRTARDIPDQFLFGPAFLVSPITNFGSRERSVYLPGRTMWYDFWTGRSHVGESWTTAEAPYDQIPLFVKAGAIVPFGPEIQYIGEKPADPITLLIYAGADGDFVLYEDDGLTYAYEKGASSQIAFHWNEAKRTLNIAARQGTFPGMLKERTFRIALVTKDKPIPFSFDLPAAATFRYRGEAGVVKVP